jgi:hypothetical protein
VLDSMERETGIEPATSSLGKGHFIVSKRLKRLWDAFSTLTSLAESVTSLFDPTNRGTNEVHLIGTPALFGSLVDGSPIAINETREISDLPPSSQRRKAMAQEGLVQDSIDIRMSMLLRTTDPNIDSERAKVLSDLAFT